MNIRFVLVCEGTSDEGLVPHLQFLCVECGASEAIGVAADFSRLPISPGRSLASRLNAAKALEPSANLLFVHRDADSRVETARLSEISQATGGTGVQTVPVIPIQETEAWLLLDEDAIRSVVENPEGTVPLVLPRPQNVERVADPKTRLKKALAFASELRGRRLRKLKKDFPRYRKLLLQRLDTRGPLAQVPAWQRLVNRTEAAVRTVAGAY